MALAVRPNCEPCERDLPPEAAKARMGSDERTFRTECVERRLFKVGPNCDGGFAPRPIRPRNGGRASPC